MTTEERLAKVEQELGRAKRRSRWLLAALGLGLGVLALVWVSAASTLRAEAQDAAGGRTVRANAFILEDEGGRVRAVLAVTEDGVLLSLLDEKGKPRASLSAFKQGPGLNLHDEKSKASVGLGVNKEGPGLDMYDAAGKRRAGLAVVADKPVLGLFDAAGKASVGLGVGADGPMLELYDENGTPRVTLGAGQTKTPDGKTITYPESSLLLFGADGKGIWSAP